MKKALPKLSIILSLFLLISLVSCTGTGDEQSATTSDISEITITETTGQSVSETTAKSASVLQAVSLDILPEFIGGKAQQDYDCGNGVYMRYISSVLTAKHTAYLTTLDNEGFTKISENKIGKNCFATYVKDTTQLYVYFITGDAEVRLIVMPYDSTADARINNTDTGSGEVLLTQVGINYTSVINGMSYIIRTPTGSFIIIDGGWADQGEAEKILGLLNEQNENGDKPVVAAWILTHPHSDHIGAISEFSKLYYDQIVIERIVYNFVSDKTMSLSDSDAMISDYNSYYNTLRRALSDLKVWADVERIKPHTGQILTFDGVSITILCTHEDLFPNTDALKYMNGASLAFMLETVGNRTLFLGDCTATDTKQISERFVSWLKCDYLQPTHHGSTGGNLNLYKYASPKVCLWCSSIPRFEEYKDSEFNQYLLKNVSEHYYSGDGTVTLTVVPK